MTNEPSGTGPSSTPEACVSCGEGVENVPDERCPKSERACGHHCNHSWTDDACDWCGWTWGEDGAVAKDSS